MTIEESLKKLMLERYGTVKDFALRADLPYTTVDAILRRGILNSGLSNVLKICETLRISADALADGKIIPLCEPYKPLPEITERLAFFLGNLSGARLDGEPLEENEIRILTDQIDAALWLIRRNRE